MTAQKFGLDLNNGNCTFSPGDHQKDREELCLFRTAFKGFGPFLTAQFAVFMPKSKYAELIPWAVDTRRAILEQLEDPQDSFDFFLHPNSGCESLDHAGRSIFIGHQH